MEAEMRWGSAALAILLLVSTPLAGLELSEEYVESFLDSLPYRLLYCTRREMNPAHSFATVKVVREDGVVDYALYTTRLALPEHPGSTSYRQFYTQYFYLVPTTEETIMLFDPIGREIAPVVTDRPIAPSENAARQMQDSISEFSQLVASYRKWEQDDSGEQFWGFFGLSLAMGGLTGLGVWGVRTLEESTDVLLAGGSAICTGFLTIACGAFSVALFCDCRRKRAELRALEARLEALTAPESR
jgi:hypothetical protein